MKVYELVRDDDMVTYGVYSTQNNAEAEAQVLSIDKKVSYVVYETIVDEYFNTTVISTYDENGVRIGY